MSSMPMIAPAATSSQAGNAAAAAQGGAPVDGLEQLFAQLMAQIQAALEQSQSELDGTALPLDGEALPPELLDQLVAQLSEFAQELPAAAAELDPQQLEQLVQQLADDGVAPEQIPQLGQAALLLYDAQPRQAESQTLAVVAEQLRLAQGTESGDASSQGDQRAIDELLALAARVHSRVVQSDTVREGMQDVDAELSATQGTEESVQSQQPAGPVAERFDADQAGLPASELASPQSEVGVDAQAAVVRNDVAAEAAERPSVERGAAADVIASQRAATTVGIASPRSDVTADSVRQTAVDSSAQSGRAEARTTEQANAQSGQEGRQEGRQESRGDSPREQALARWAELRDSVVAQGQKLASNDALFKGVLGQQGVVKQGEVINLAQASSAASLTQLQQAYQNPNGQSLTLGLNERFGSERWTPAASQRIVWMVSQNVTAAELRLDPPELGSLNVRVNITGDQASLSFTSPHPQVREVLEQQLPRLREMLADSGLELEQADVSDRSHPGREEDDERRSGAGAELEEIELANQQDELSQPVQMSLALVDFYA